MPRSSSTAKHSRMDSLKYIPNHFLHHAFCLLLLNRCSLSMSLVWIHRQMVLTLVCPWPTCIFHTVRVPDSLGSFQCPAASCPEIQYKAGDQLEQYERTCINNGGPLSSTVYVLCIRNQDGVWRAPAAAAARPAPLTKHQIRWFFVIRWMLLFGSFHSACISIIALIELNTNFIEKAGYLCASNELRGFVNARVMRIRKSEEVRRRCR